jgi:hypothetical protein
MNKFKEDINFGKNSEKEIYEILKNKYPDIERTSEYSVFDFISENEKLKIELKTRRNESNKYFTTMIGLNKIKECNDVNTTYLFIFNFTDQILFIKYDKEIFNKFLIKLGGRYDRKRSGELSQYIYIPITALTPIEDL